MCGLKFPNIGSLLWTKYLSLILYIVCMVFLRSVTSYVLRCSLQDNEVPSVLPASYCIRPSLFFTSFYLSLFLSSYLVWCPSSISLMSSTSSFTMIMRTVFNIKYATLRTKSGRSYPPRLCSLTLSCMKAHHLGSFSLNLHTLTGGTNSHSVEHAMKITHLIRKMISQRKQSWVVKGGAKPPESDND